VKMLQFKIGERVAFTATSGRIVSGVITRYNNSDYYAMSVFQLAEELKAAHKSSARK